jgi:hypothetical protein
MCSLKRFVAVSSTELGACSLRCRTSVDLSSGLLLRLSRAETNQLGGESYCCEVWMAETDMLMMRVTLLRWICRKWSNVCCCGGALDERGETNQHL